MIKIFIFENFKSFEEAKFELEQLTILIGTNAANIRFIDTSVLLNILNVPLA